MKTAVMVVPMAWALLFPGQSGPVAASGWKLRPAGRQVALGRLPMSAAISPDGKYLAV